MEVANDGDDGSSESSTGDGDSAMTSKRPENEQEPALLDVGTYSFQTAKKIGEGTYGTVYKAYDSIKQKYFAVKKIKLDSREGVPGTCLREVSILKEIKHPNIVKLLDVLPPEGHKHLYLVFEYVEQDLEMLMGKLKPIPLPTPYIKSFLWQMFRALSHCHTHRVMHRDLKPQNILVETSGTVKLADFGLARSFSIPSRCYTHEIVTLWYRAPEILLRSRFYSTAVDIWSLACIFAEMVTTEPLFTGNSEIAVLYDIFQTLGTPTPEMWPALTECLDYNAEFPQWKECQLAKRVPGLDNDGLDLLAQMLLYPQEERMTSKAALSHRFLSDLPINLDPITSLVK